MIFQAIENVCINFFSFFLLAQFPTYFTYLHLHIRFVRPIDLFFLSLFLLLLLLSPPLPLLLLVIRSDTVLQVEQRKGRDESFVPSL